MSSLVPQSSANLLGFKTLNNILVADAFDEASRGRASEADRAMRAAWKLAQSARNQPLMIGEFVAMSLASTDSSAVRRLAVDAGTWRPQLAGYNYPAGFERAVEAETVRRLRANAGGSMTTRAYLTGYLDGMRANLLRMRTLSLTDEPNGSPTDLGNSALWRTAVETGSAGSVVATIARPGLDRAWLTALGVMLDIEFTDRVLDVRQVKAKTGRWPAALPDVASTEVPGARWVYAVSGDGGISISLSRSVPAYGPPPRFEARR
jgi:hypothetical protein